MKIRHKKWLLATLLLAAGIVLVTGYVTKDIRKVRKVVSTEFNDLTHPDEKTIKEYLSAKMLFPEQESASNAALPPQITDIFVDFFKNFHYKIKKVKIFDGGKSTVTVKIKNIDTRALAKDYAAAALRKRITGDANPSQVEFSLKDYYLLLGETLKTHTYDLVDSSFDIHLVKFNNNWEIVQQELVDNEVSGNFLSYMADSNLLTPEEVVQIHFDTIKGFDTEQLNIYLSLDSLLDTDGSYSSSIAHSMAVQIGKFFDYEILSSSNAERNATVKVNITSCDFKSIVSSYQEKLAVWLQTSEALSGGAKGRREKEREMLLESIDQNTNSTTTAIDIQLINDGTNWKMQMGEDVAQSVLGGVNSALADVSEDVE